MANKWDTVANMQYYKAGGTDDILNVKHIMQQRDSNRLKEVTTLGYNYSIVGMDANKIGSAVQAINDYVRRLENKARELNESADMNVALKSDVIQAAVKNYIEKVEEYCANLCSQLTVFRDRIQEAETAWRAHAEALSETISADTASFDAGTHRE